MVDVSGLLDAGRGWAESLMIDTCLIRRQMGLVTDPATGAVTAAYETVYQGKCKVQTFTNRELFKDAAVHQFIVQRYEVDIPVSVAGVEPNDEVLMVSSVFDPDLAGRSYRVVGLMNKSMATARRLGVEEMTN